MWKSFFARLDGSIPRVVPTPTPAAEGKSIHMMCVFNWLQKEAREGLLWLE